MPITQDIYDSIVHSSDGDHTTIADAITAVGADSVIYVRCGTYAGFTCSVDNVVIMLQPGTTISSAVTLSGAGCVLLPGSNCTLSGKLNLDGARCGCFAQNGFTFQNVDLDGVTCTFDGGGKGSKTTTEQVVLNGNSSIAKNFTIDTSGGTNASIVINGDACAVSGVYIEGSADYGIQISGGNAMVFGNYIEGTGDHSIFSDSSGVNGGIIACNTIKGSTGYGIYINDKDDFVIWSNIVDSGSSGSISLQSGSNDNVVCGNRIDGALSDSSGDSIVDENETGAF